MIRTLLFERHDGPEGKARVEVHEQLCGFRLGRRKHQHLDAGADAQQDRRPENLSREGAFQPFQPIEHQNHLWSYVF